MNKVFISGRLTRDPELRYTATQKAVCNFSVAVKTGKDKAYFIDVEVWERQAEACSQYLGKGSQVIVEGRWKERSWEKDGVKHKKVSVGFANVEFVGGKQEPSEDATDDIEPF